MNTFPSMEEQFLAQVNKSILANLGNEAYSVEQLAGDVGLSRSMLHRKLKKLTGKSATDLLTETRLLEAKKMLDNNVATASEIAYRVGFNSPSYFNAVFKKRFGLSPGEVRKTALIPRQKIVLEPEKSKSNKNGWLLILLIVILFSALGSVYLLRREKKTQPEKSIAVLPFDNLSPVVENQYFADGLVDDLLSRLSTIEGLKVISRTSSEAFRDKQGKTIAEIASILGVSYILEGTIQREKNTIRIQVQLIDALNDDHIMSKQYDTDFDNLFSVQSDIAQSISNELQVYLTNKQLEKLNLNYTENINAFNYYQLGRYKLNRRSFLKFHESIRYFKKALREDEKYALAYLGLADAYYNLAWHQNKMSDKSYRDSAEIYALKALKLNDDIGDAHAILGSIYRELDYNMQAAEEQYQFAIHSNTTSFITYKEYAEYLSVLGRDQEAREMINKALSIDPMNFIVRLISATMFKMQGEYAKALEENSLCLELVNNHPWALENSLSIYFHLEDGDAALVTYKKLDSTSNWYTSKDLDSIYKVSGLNGLIDISGKVSDWYPHKLNCYVLLGENEKALEALEFAFDSARLRPYDFYQIHADSLKNEPRFLAIKKKLGIFD